MEENTVNKSLDNHISKKEINEARKVINSFLVAMKNHSLFPQEHINCQKSLENVKNCLNEFLDKYKTIRFYVEKEKLIFQGNIVHQESPQNKNLASVLFRDGIEWLEFHQYLESKEIIRFFKILQQYRLPQQDAEGDVVTALWEENFPHLRYSAKDISWESEPITDFSSFNVTNGKHSDINCLEGNGQENGMTRWGNEQNVVSNLASPTLDHSLWQLTPKEMKELRRMVYFEENRSGTDDVLDVLVVILEEQNNEKDFMSVLDFLKEEFQNTLEQAELRLVFNLLRSLHKVRTSYQNRKPWAVPLIDKFFTEISSPDILGVLLEMEPVIASWDSDQIRLFWQILRLLSPEAVLTLAPMLIQISSDSILKMLTNIISTMANRDIRPIVQLLNNSEEALIIKLIHILRRLRGNKPTQTLLRMIYHPSRQVRKETLEALVNRESKILKRLFLLIEDPDETIRQMMIESLGRYRNQTAEELLLDYLEYRRFRRTDSQHIFECYRALGRCGSSLSIPFLQSALLDQGWKTIVGANKSLERQGAAIALIELGTKEALTILKKASRSLFPGVRMAYQKAIEVKHDNN